MAPEFNSAVTITDQSLAATGSYRYLSFNPTSVSVGGGPCCGDSVYGLDEMRLSGSLAHGMPEPTSWALMIGGFGMAGAMLRRLRSSPDLRPDGWGRLGWRWSSKHQAAIIRKGRP